jgi:hypothetical protein
MMGKIRVPETDSIYKLIRASATNHFDYVILGRSYGTAHMGNNTLIILKIQDWKINVWIGMVMPFLSLTKKLVNHKCIVILSNKKTILQMLQ